LLCYQLLYYLHEREHLRTLSRSKTVLVDGLQLNNSQWRTSAQIKRDEEKAKQSKISGIAEKKRGEKEDILDMYHQYTQYEWRTIEQMKRDDGKGTQKRKPKEDVYELYSERQYTGYEWRTSAQMRRDLEGAQSK